MRFPVSISPLRVSAAPAPCRGGTSTDHGVSIAEDGAPPTSEQFKILSSREVPDTVRLYLAGKIDQWYCIQNDNGAVFILNLSSVEDAHSMLEALPLGQAKLMTFQLIPIGPLSPLALLLPHPEKPALADSVK